MAYTLFTSIVNFQPVELIECMDAAVATSDVRPANLHSF